MAVKVTREASSSSSSTPRWTYDVFLSFRGEDTRNNFTHLLYRSLIQKGIHTFKDDDELRKGEVIAAELLKAIEDSRIAIIVFSRNYASSRWCLGELVKILECKKTLGQTVLPVFYDVDPSDVQKQTGNFAEAFARHEERFKGEMNKVERWRAALRETENLSGWDLRNVADGHESKFIQGIVEDVTTRLNQSHLNVAVYPIGIDSRVEELNLLLNVGSNDVRIIGIYGMGGIGKTTITKAVYNLIYHKFDGSSFLANVREVSEQPNGLVRLQKQLLSDISMEKSVEISNDGRGMIMIEKNERVLVVLDDVNQLNQINALVGQRPWFGVGSRIIITTRDEHFLNELEVDEIYEVKELNYNESLQLFSWHAFKKHHPIEDYAKLSSDMVDYLGGLPLALEVLGSFLFDKRSISEWKSALEKLKRIPDNQIQEKLRISFDALDDMQKYLFLDIACFFVGMDKNYAIKILDGCGFLSKNELSVLIRRSLVIITENNELRMHDLLRDMGREIVRKESPKELGKRSRLWYFEDAYDVLTKHKGTEAVEGLTLNLPKSKKLNLSIEAFVMMQKLRLLQINYVHLTRGYEHLSKELRWLCWHGFPLTYIPTNFNLENLISLDMQYSCIRQVWKEMKLLKNLKDLNLSHSHSLTRTPDFLGLPSLERLILEGCSNLVEVHQSIGDLDGLVFLNLQDCRNLTNIPVTICKLRSLEQLILSGCSKLDKLPEGLGNIEHLTELLAEGTAIKQLPISIGHLKNLKSLSLQGCKGSPSKAWYSFFSSWVSLIKCPNSISLLPASFSGLCSLKSLILKDCNLLEGTIPDDLGSIALLQELDLGHNSFCTLPASISRLSHLRLLRLRKCPRLQSLPELPSSLETLYAEGCTSIESLSNLERLSGLVELDMSYTNLRSLPDSINSLSELVYLKLEHCTRLQSLPELPSSLYKLNAEGCTSIERLSTLSNLQDLPSLMFRNCDKIVEIQDLEKLESVRIIHMEGCYNLANTFRKRLLQGLIEGVEFNIFLPGSEVPEWFSHHSMGSSVYFEVPQLSDSKVQELTICAIYAADREAHENDIDPDAESPFANVSNKTTGVEWRYCATTWSIPITRQYHMWVGHIPHTEFESQLELKSGDQVEVSIEIEPPIQVKKCAIHLVYGPDEKGSQSDDEAVIQYTSSDDDVANEDGSDVDNISTKRGCDDHEVGPNSFQSNEEEQGPKRLKIERGPTVDGEEGEGGGYYSYF